MLRPDFGLGQIDPVGQVREPSVVAVDDTLARLQMEINAFQLRKPDSSSHVRHPIIVADNLEPVALLGVHALAAKEPQARRKCVVVGGDHPAFTSSDDFITEEAERAAVAMTAKTPALVARTDGFGRILQ